MDTPDPATSTKPRRFVSALFGAFFVALALVTVVTADASTRVPAIAVAVVVGGLGLDLIISALRGKRSMLSRLGPLP